MELLSCKPIVVLHKTYKVLMINRRALDLDAQRRGSAAAERSEAVRWNRLLGASARFKLPADVYGQDLVFCIPLFCVIRSQIQI